MTVLFLQTLYDKAPDYQVAIKAGKDLRYLCEIGGAAIRKKILAPLELGVA